MPLVIDISEGSEEGRALLRFKKDFESDVEFAQFLLEALYLYNEGGIVSVLDALNERVRKLEGEKEKKIIKTVSGKMVGYG